MPDTRPTEKVIITTPKSLWNDFVMKYVSGIALLEILSRSGILKVFDGKLSLTDGVDKAVNASKVFSIGETDYGKEMRRSENVRRHRQGIYFFKYFLFIK